MEQVWTPQEAARKEAMLEAHGPLSANAQTAIHCAECILKRLVGEQEQHPGFTGTEIQRCTGLSEMVVTHTMQKIIRAGLLAKEVLLPAAIHGSRPLAFYRPQAQADGQFFFMPATAPGCERTTQQNALEMLKPTQRAALACIAHLTTVEAANTDVSRPNVGACTALNQQTLGSVFESFMRMDLLEVLDSRRSGNMRRASRYAVTEKGRWPTQGLPPLATCKLGQNKACPAKTPEKRPAEGIDSWIIQRIQDRYPEQLRTAILARLVTLMNQGILQTIPGSSHTPSSEQTAVEGLHAVEMAEQIEFLPQPAAYLGRTGEVAIAHWLHLDPLLYGRLLPSQDVRRMLRLSPEANLGQHVRTRLYEPLIARLAKAGKSRTITARPRSTKPPS